MVDDNDIDEEDDYEDEDDDDVSSILSFSISKEDIIIIFLLVISGGVLGYIAGKLMNKHDKEPCMLNHYPHYQQFMAPPEEAPNTERMYIPKSKKNKNKERYAENGARIIDPPAVNEIWVIKRDFNGDIIDAFKQDGAEWVT